MALAVERILFTSKKPTVIYHTVHGFLFTTLIIALFTTELGRVFAANKIRLVYGGGSVGLMGAVAKGVLENGGEAIGIVPEPLYRHGSKQLCETVIVPDMHARKKRMEEESDAFVCLPGGYGSFEEILETICWSQLNIHSKPIVLLNTKNFYKLFVDFINMSVQGTYCRANFILSSPDTN